MSRRPAKVTQADLARAIRAAKQAGAGDVTVTPDGSIRIGLAPVGSQAGKSHFEVEPDPGIVL